MSLSLCQLFYIECLSIDQFHLNLTNYFILSPADKRNFRPRSRREQKLLGRTNPRAASRNSSALHIVNHAAKRHCDEPQSRTAIVLSALVSLRNIYLKNLSGSIMLCYLHKDSVNYSMYVFKTQHHNGMGIGYGIYIQANLKLRGCKGFLPSSAPPVLRLTPTNQLHI